MLHTTRTEAEDTPKIGARLRAIRQERGLSQRELARRAGVTNATISLIEKNKSSPSVSSLKKVLDGLPMSLAEFFALEIPPGDQIFFRADELPVFSEGGVSFRQLGGDGDRHQLQILHESYPPGADTGETMLSHESEEGGLVLTGRIEVTVGDQQRILGPGDAYYFDSRTPHRFRNVGDEPCEIISACTPPYL
ncbi:MAG: cupin domain-containing protein [Gammaproteobacteria bacterium]|nr:cupin domain-containing protein [Gammaproteobacteria bacterium]